MPRGDKDKYSEKQKRKAAHIEESYEKKGVAPSKAEARAWATVNKQSGGGEKKGGSGQHKSATAKAGDRKDSARRAAATRQGRSPARGTSRGPLESLKRDELMERAAREGIVGRSRMRKAQLIEALRAA